MTALSFAPPVELNTLTASIKESTDTMVKHAGDGCDIFGTIGSSFNSAIKGIADAAEKATADMLKAIGKVAQFMKDIGDKISAAISKVMTKIKTLAKDAVAALASKVTAAIAAVKSAVNSAISAVGNVIKNAVTAIGNAFTALKKELAKALDSISIMGCNIMQDASASIGSGVSAELDNAKNAEIAPPASLTAACSAALSSVNTPLAAISKMPDSLSSGLGTAATNLELAVA